MTTLVFFTFGLITKSGRTGVAFNCVCYMIFGGLFNGYFSARAMKFFGAEEWSYAAMASSVILPLWIGVPFLMVDFVDWIEKADQMVPFTSIVGYLFLWGCLNVPAVSLASWYAFMNSNDKPPCKVSLVRKQVPNQPFYMHITFMTPLASFVIFSTVMIEFHYVITSIWRSYVLGMFAFIFVNLNLMAMVISLVSILCTYYHLQHGNWAWWWPSFFNGLAVGTWVGIYILYTGIVEFHVSGFATDMVYLIYTIVFS